MDKIKFEGKLFQIIEKSRIAHIKTDGNEIEKEVVWEMASRPPGVRAVIVQEDFILLNKEYRYELGKWDYRLPGGKVFDSLKEYAECRKKEDIEQKIYSQLQTELREEADIEIHDAKLLRMDTLGFRIEWDLYYYLVQKFDILPSFYSSKSQKTEYEFIEHCWVGMEEALQICIKGEMQESRSAYTLMSFLLNKSKEFGSYG